MREVTLRGYITSFLPCQGKTSQDFQINMSRCNLALKQRNDKVYTLSLFYSK